jgi:hypothetical protein
MAKITKYTVVAVVMGVIVYAVVQQYYTNRVLAECPTSPMGRLEKMIATQEWVALRDGGQALAWRRGRLVGRIICREYVYDADGKLIRQ